MIKFILSALVIILVISCGEKKSQSSKSTIPSNMDTLSLPEAKEGPVRDSIRVLDISERLKLSGNRSYVLKWQEIALSSKHIENRINETIRGNLRNYKTALLEAEGSTEYEIESTIPFAKDSLVSCFITSYEYGENALHGFRDFKTLNFNTQTGMLINFHDLFIENQRSPVDSIVMSKLEDRLKESEFHRSDWESQMPDPNFLLDSKGIKVLFKGPNYQTSIIELFFTKEEFRPFLKISGLWN
ncbi:hypothetical protein [Desertivirga arenae]|uniref:hypothetical protein n=1 Tax=Desertivirga arenae TaxID=2810309 RepID=UPI001A97415E|nr:hypothetical protein [Pedobacter sp. SYSU D00823]